MLIIFLKTASASFGREAAINLVNAHVDRMQESPYFSHKARSFYMNSSFSDHVFYLGRIRVLLMRCRPKSIDKRWTNTQAEASSVKNVFHLSDLIL
jgi:hypothetical protein